MYIKMTDIDMELREVTVNGEIVYVTRCGELWRWTRHRWNAPKFRKIDTKVDAKGYIYPWIGGKRVPQHRIIASAFLGLDMSDTTIQVDHRNGIRHDNRLDNLRLVTPQQNQHNHTKAKGYSWNKQHNKWHAGIYLDRRKIHLGLFDVESEARQAYLDAKIIYHKIP